MREKFLIAYELKGCQRALTEYYGVRRMIIILDGAECPKDVVDCISRTEHIFQETA
jgi:hypothetical protein